MAHESTTHVPTAVGVPMGAFYSGGGERSAAGTHNAEAAAVVGDEVIGSSGTPASLVGDHAALAHESIPIGIGGDGENSKTCARSAIERHLRNLIPDQQQSSSSNQNKGEQSIVTTRVIEAVHPRNPCGISTAAHTVSTNPFDPGFVGSTADLAAHALEKSCTDTLVPPVGDSTIAKFSLAEDEEVACKEGSRETLVPALSAGDGGHAEDETLPGAGGGVAEEARTELKRLVRSEKGRGYFLQV